MNEKLEVIPIFMSIGKSIIEPTSVMMASILANTKSYIKFYILMNTKDAFTTNDKKKLEHLKNHFNNFEINYIDINPIKFQGLNLPIAPQVKIDTYFRFLIPNLDKSVDKAIYLDFDTIILKDISELYNENLNGKLIGVTCKDKRGKMTDRLLEIVNKTGIKNPYSYFNAGVLLLDCKKMREYKITEELFRTAQEWNDKIDFADQDVLNIVFEGKYQELSEKYNQYAHIINNEADINLIHYVGPHKPWLESWDNDVYFWKYAKKYSPFYRELYKKRYNYRFIQELLSIKNINENKVISFLGLRIKFKKHLIKKLFSIINENKHKVINLLGIKFKFKNKSYKIALKEQKEQFNRQIQKLNEELHNFKEDIFHSGINTFPAYSIKDILNITTQHDKYYAACSLIPKECQNLQYLFPNINIEELSESNANSDLYFLWGTRYNEQQERCLNLAINNNKPLYVFEDGFLKSVASPHDKRADLTLRQTLAFTLNSSVVYFDGTKVSELEKLLNDKNLVITYEQKQRARRCIDKIVENYLTKYNHQPIFTPNIGRKGVKKVLVVDQTYGDMAIAKSCANSNTFKKMLECAIEENPNADIIIKTHPDTLLGAVKGYYSGFEEHDNIYTYTEAINPISLIQYCDEIYVCSSQMGFEALMCNKKVHVFGISYYSNYGITQDYQNCPRRCTKRDIEEMFYIIYIMFSYYIDAKTKEKCEIENTIDYIIENRNKLLKDYNLTNTSKILK